MIKLISEPGIHDLTEAQKASIMNGAGAAGDWRSKFIPNTVYGLDCTEVFNLHDYAYYKGKTQEDKERADTSMLINMLRLINAKGGYLAIPRRYRAVTYYDAVHEFGHDAFFVNG